MLGPTDVRVVVGIALASTILGAVVLPGCQGNECNGDFVEVVHDPYVSRVTQGDFVDDETWESSPVTGTWLDFSGQRTIHVRIVPWENAGRTPTTMTGYVSTAAVPNAASVRPDGITDNWTVGAGNLVEFRDVSPGNFSVTNATCQQFYLRLVVHSSPPSPSVADSGTEDAQTE